MATGNGWGTWRGTGPTHHDQAEQGRTDRHQPTPRPGHGRRHSAPSVGVPLFAIARFVQNVPNKKGREHSFCPMESVHQKGCNFPESGPKGPIQGRCRGGPWTNNSTSPHLRARHELHGKSSCTSRSAVARLRGRWRRELDGMPQNRDQGAIVPVGGGGVDVSHDVCHRGPCNGGAMSIGYEIRGIHRSVPTVLAERLSDWGDWGWGSDGEKVLAARDDRGPKSALRRGGGGGSGGTPSKPIPMRHRSFVFSQKKCVGALRPIFKPPPPSLQHTSIPRCCSACSSCPRPIFHPSPSPGPAPAAATAPGEVESLFEPPRNLAVGAQKRASRGRAFMRGQRLFANVKCEGDRSACRCWTAGPCPPGGVEMNLPIVSALFHAVGGCKFEPQGFGVATTGTKAAASNSPKYRSSRVRTG